MWLQSVITEFGCIQNEQAPPSSSDVLVGFPRFRLSFLQCLLQVSCSYFKLLEVVQLSNFSIFVIPISQNEFRNILECFVSVWPITVAAAPSVIIACFIARVPDTKVNKRGNLKLHHFRKSVALFKAVKCVLLCSIWMSHRQAQSRLAIISTLTF